MNTSIGDFSIKVGEEYIFKPTTGKESLHESVNGVIAVHSDSQTQCSRTAK
jgi:hypothetical protein